MAKVGGPRLGETGVNKFRYRPEFKQTRRKNNDLYASCYALYLTGKSLQYIAEVHYRKRFTRQTLHDAFKARGYKMRSKRKLPEVIYKNTVYRPDPAGLWRTTKDPKTYLHHRIWEEHNGPRPPGYYVLHRDGNKDNNSIENLECIPAAEGKKRYNHANQFGWQRFQDRGQFGKGKNDSIS